MRPDAPPVVLCMTDAGKVLEIGIPGVDNGKRRVAVYVDGKLNTASWRGDPGDRLAVLTTGRLGLMGYQGAQGGSVVFDNIRIWSHAKTDFSDRDEETPR
jgi:hypothetical protein